MKKSELIDVALCSRKWFDFVLQNPDKVTSNHAYVFLWAAELSARKQSAGGLIFPTSDVMVLLGIKSRTTYGKIMEDLENWKMIKILKWSKNQFQDTVIEIIGCSAACPINEQPNQNGCPIDEQPKNACPINGQPNENGCSINGQPTDGCSIDGQPNSTTHVGARVEVINNNILNNNILINNSSKKELTTSKENQQRKVSPDKKEAPLKIPEPVPEPKPQPQPEPASQPEKPKPKRRPAKPKEPIDESEFSLIHRIRLRNEKDNIDVKWSGLHAARAVKLVERLTWSFKQTHKREPEEFEVFASFEFLVDNLPLWAKHYTIDFLVKHYERIIQDIKNTPKDQRNGTYKDRSAQYHADKNASLARTLQNLNERAYANGGKSEVSSYVDSILARAATKNDFGHSIESTESDFEFTE